MNFINGKLVINKNNQIKITIKYNLSKEGLEYKGDINISYFKNNNLINQIDIKDSICIKKELEKELIKKQDVLENIEYLVNNRQQKEYVSFVVLSILNLVLTDYIKNNIKD